MSFPLIFMEYAVWHYTKGLAEFLRAWGNIHWFLFKFFSTSMMIKTFFQPLHRVKESYAKTFDIQKIAESLLVNTIMRGVGMIFRLVFLSLSFVSEVAAFGAGFLLFILYIGAPIVIPLAFVTSFFILF